LNKNKIILEATSGNTGIGLALVGRLKGYKVTLTMSSAMSIERKRMLKVFGAKIIETDPTKGTDGAIIKAKEMFRENPDEYWMSDQFSNEQNPLVHYSKTAEEIITQLPEITTFVAGIGTSGTLMGISKRLKEHNSEIEIIGVEPELNHRIQGLKNMKEAIVPDIYKEEKLDHKIVVSTEDAYETARQLASEEGIFVGMSSGAAMWAAIKAAEEMDRGNIVVLFPDRGEKYLSTELFNF